MSDYTTEQLDADVKRYVEIQAKTADLNIELEAIKQRFRDNLPAGLSAAPCGVSVSVTPQRRFNATKAAEVIPDELLVLCYETQLSASKAKAALPPAIYELAMVESGVPRVVVS